MVFLWGRNVEKSVFFSLFWEAKTEQSRTLTSFLPTLATKSVDNKISFNAAQLQIVSSLELHYTNNHLLLLSERTQNGLDDSSTKSWELSPPVTAPLSITGSPY